MPASSRSVSCNAAAATVRMVARSNGGRTALIEKLRAPIRAQNFQSERDRQYAQAHRKKRLAQRGGDQTTIPTKPKIHRKIRFKP